jgi:hypothetical protein
MGATPEGKKELIGFLHAIACNRPQTGMRESAQSWKELLVDLKARGLSIAPQVAIGDGAPNLTCFSFWSSRHSRNSNEPRAAPSSRHSSIAVALISFAHPPMPKHATTIAILNMRTSHLEGSQASGAMQV